MNQDSTRSLKMLKHCAIAVAALMVAGIVTLMILSRGTGEDIAGIVAPALLIAILSVIVATAAAIAQKWAQKAIDVNSPDDPSL